MRIFLSIFVSFLSLSVFAQCDFVKSSNVVSLSGTATVLFKELGLLPKLRGISVFNPIPPSEFSGKVYPGGIFLSQNALGELKGARVFFDESRELGKIFRSQEINAIEIRTRNQTPTETIHRTLKEIIPLTIGCDKKVAELEKKRIQLEQKIMNLIPLKKSILFFLGELKNDRLPEMIMANDGIVKWLRQQDKISTYPSDLAYVNWSAKILQDLQGMKYVGITDPSRDNKKEVKVNGTRINFSYPGSLVPGLSQLEAFAYLFEKLK